MAIPRATRAYDRCVSTRLSPHRSGSFGQVVLRIELPKERRPLGLTLDHGCDSVHVTEYSAYEVATGIGNERRERDAGIA